MTAREAHPVADLFPMLAADELADLAASIKEHGLDQPIMLDASGRILDGRNRLAACEMAGVEPRFETYEADDADDYALRSGNTRRHLSTGARAMIAAQAARLKGRTQSDVAAETGISSLRISDANVVLDWCDATVVKAVIVGTKPLSKAVDEARQLKKEDAARESKKNRLREGAPDLLARVGEGLDLDEALGALETREQRARQEAEQVRREAEAIASEEERQRRVLEQERQESLERDRDRIRAVINGWGSVQLIMREPDSGRVLDIVDGLMPGDQKELTAILAEVTGGAQA